MSLIIIIISVLVLVIVSIVSYLIVSNKPSKKYPQPQPGPQPGPGPGPKPSLTKYSCVDNSCIIDENGIYNSIEKCKDICEVSPDPSSTKYSCINNGCVSDSKGIYTTLVDCNNNCKSPDIKCIDNTSFQQSAQDNVSPMYDKFYKCLSQSEFSCVRAKEILSLRDYLSIFSFAYFPLNKTKLSYTTHSINKKDVNNPKKSEVITTSDPVEIVIYYTAQLYTIIGDIGDAKSGNNQKLVDILTPVADALKASCVDVFENNTMKDPDGNPIKGLTWDKYFKYPGPLGKKWDDGTTVNWSISTDYKDINNALYLNLRSFLSNQFWGKTQPTQGSTTSQAIGNLIKIQIEESIKKYNALLALDDSGSGNWATKDILNNSKNIDTYHVFRKAIRSLERTIEKFPTVISGFYSHLSQQLVAYVNKKYSTSVTTKQTYGDVFCLNGFNCGDDIVYPIANLMFIGAFDSSFYGLTDNDFKCIRAVLLLKLTYLGSKNASEFKKEYLKNAVPCPASVPNYKTDPYAPYTWTEPKLDNDNGNISGNICELVDFFGDIHDDLVLVQQQLDKGRKPHRDLLDYCVGACQALEKFMNSIKMVQVLNDIKGGLC